MKPIIDYVDAVLNSITMYRLVLYVLLTISSLALILSLLGLMSYDPVALVLSAAVLVGVSWSVNQILALLFKAQTSVEASLITGLILFLILKPTSDPLGLLVLVAAGVVAVAPKYFFGPLRSVFNPAAIAALTVSFLGLTSATWWVGSKVLLPVVFVAGVLLIRKLHKFQLVGLFWLTVLAVVVVTAFIDGSDKGAAIKIAVLSGPLVFMGTVMLTEPTTLPPTRKWQWVYAVVVGLLFSVQFQLGPLDSSPELALVAGNLLGYAVSGKRRITLRWVKTTQLAPSLYEFIFTSNYWLKYQPGQYSEWTLSHHRPDDRGTRRFFTVASAPNGQTVRLMARINPESMSSYKRAMLQLKAGSVVGGGKMEGDFTLPRSPDQKLGWIAGGIGVTPFVAMAEWLGQSQQQRDVAMLYTAAKPTEFLVDELWTNTPGLRLTKVVTDQKSEGWQGETGFIDAAMLRRNVPDFKERRWYISGPNAMVVNYRWMLIKAGVPFNQIVTDYFSGY
ncbi:FAD-dependent oxidoreductase [Patescibacteria group bacterium]|nr:MAG: FAD-dependent oxidoreductase [Patescibacteria group bacterium]